MNSSVGGSIYEDQGSFCPLQALHLVYANFAFPASCWKRRAARQMGGSSDKCLASKVISWWQPQEKASEDFCYFQLSPVLAASSPQPFILEQPCSASCGGEEKEGRGRVGGGGGGVWAHPDTPS